MGQDNDKNRVTDGIRDSIWMWSRVKIESGKICDRIRSITIHWKGYDSVDDTWEHPSALEHAPDILAKYRKKANLL